VPEQAKKPLTPMSTKYDDKVRMPGSENLRVGPQVDNIVVREDQVPGDGKLTLNYPESKRESPQLPAPGKTAQPTYDSRWPLTRCGICGKPIHSSYGVGGLDPETKKVLCVPCWEKRTGKKRVVTHPDMTHTAKYYADLAAKQLLRRG